MKYALLALSLTLLITSCSKKAEAETIAVTSPTPLVSPSPSPSPEPQHTCKLDLGKVVWHQGTICPEGKLSQGHATSSAGYQVTGCYKPVIICQ